MGILRAESTGDELVLEASFLVGRSSHCSLQLPDAHVSTEHASLRWNGEHWLLRDLGSTNSTFVDGQPLQPSQSVALRAGQRLAFGDSACSFVLVDDSAPETLAQPLAGGPTLQAEGGILALPSKERPLLTIYRNGNGEWVMDNGRAIDFVQHRDVVEADGAPYRLFLAQAIAETSPVRPLLYRNVASVSLEFRVSRDEEHIELYARIGAELHDCGARNHNYLLLYLARRRLEDTAAMEPPSACGWVFQEELCQALRVDPERLNVDVYRVRRQLAALKLLDPAEIIQRRPRTKQLRLGTPSCKIERI